MVQRDEVNDIDLSVRLKHGTHSIFLFVDPSSTFAEVAEELLQICQERYPGGLTTSTMPPKTSQLPDDSAKISFAVLASPLDPAQGWKPLKAKPTDTPAGKGIKDGMIVAFAFPDGDGEEEEEPMFEVEFPSYEDEPMDE